MNQKAADRQKLRTPAHEIIRAHERELLVERHLPLAYRLASHYRDRGIPLEDIRQVAALGLVKAAAGYIDEPGRNFPSYAIPTINGELRRHFRDRGWFVRPPRALQEAQAAVRRAEETLTSELHRVPTDAELADATDVDEGAVRESRTLAACYSPRSLDAPPEGTTAAPVDMLANRDDDMASAEWRVCLAEAMRELPERDRRILALRFVEERTQAEIGAELGVTQMHISRLLGRILDSLRENLGDAMANDSTRPSAA